MIQQNGIPVILFTYPSLSPEYSRNESSCLFPLSILIGVLQLLIMENIKHYENRII